MNKYQLKEDQGQTKKQQEGKCLHSQNGTFKKKLLTSKRQLNLHTTNFHLEDVKKDSTTGII